MKTMKMFVTALVCFASVACVKENMDPENKNHELGTLAFNAVREDMSLPQVKSILDPNDKDDTDGRMMHWESGDDIIVFAAGAPEASSNTLPAEVDGTQWLQGYKFVTADTGSSATFTIESDGNAADENEFNSGADKYMMLYVYSSNYYCNVAKSHARFYVSPSQAARKGSCHADRGSAIAKVSSLDEQVEFKNLVSLLKFTVPETLSGKVASISVSGAENEHIAGDAFVDFSGDVPEVEAWHKKYGNTTARYSAALTDSKGMASGDYYLAIIPTTVTEVNVKVTLTDGQIFERSKTIEGGYEFRRSTIHYMGAIDENYARITATACEATSSTLAFTWTCGKSVEDDIARSYYLELCDMENNLIVSHEIPASLTGGSTYASGAIWKSMQPKFVFAGLAQNTSYIFRVKDMSNNLISNVATGTTTTFNNVKVPTSNVEVGDVILAEDFAEFVGGPEWVMKAAGATKSSPMQAISGNCSGNDSVIYYAFDSNAKGTSNSATFRAGFAATDRLSDWAYYKHPTQGTTATTYLYAAAGHVKMSTGSHTTSLVTPVLSAIPDNYSATLQVKVTMARNAAQVGSPLNMTVSNITGERQENLWIKDPVFKGYSEVKELTNHSEWEEYVFTIAGVENTDRLNIRPKDGGYTNGKAVHYINDVTVTVTALTPIAQ